MFLSTVYGIEETYNQGLKTKDHRGIIKTTWVDTFVFYDLTIQVPSGEVLCKIIPLSS